MISEIEVEARAYVDTHSGEHLLPCGTYLQAMLKIIDELRAPPGAEITRLREANIALQRSLGVAQNELVRCLQDQLRAAPPGADAMERARTVWQEISTLLTKWSTSYRILDLCLPIERALQQYGDERAEVERQQRFRPISAAEVERVRAAAIEELGFGEIVMMSEQRNKPGLPARWCALARGRKEAVMGDTEQEARIAALAAKPGSET